ncbi:hypothetical protein ISS05_02265 [Candidatus Woesearchaeota archaeon]|nr:hypothetical protein [Candidatus Woesearchaeota archaeon]
MKMDKIYLVYTKLLEHYGPQGWWPVTPIGGCKGKLPDAPIYGISLKNEKQKLEIIFGALLTQNTQWKPNVERAIIELNRLDFMDIDKILNAKQEVIAEAIKSSGYFNMKAKKLKNMAEFLKKYPLPELKNMDLRKARELLISINGVGPETADSILLYALNKPIFVVDAYTKRIYSRFFDIKEELKYDELQEIFENNLEKDAKLFNEYHALLVELGKNYCKNKKPLCSKCPVKADCENYRLMIKNN